MRALFTLQLTLMTLTDSASTAFRSRLHQIRDGDREAGLSTLEITVIALGLFLLAGAAVLALTTATGNRLDQIK